jgi:hypothetical protein
LSKKEFIFHVYRHYTKNEPGVGVDLSPERQHGQRDVKAERREDEVFLGVASNLESKLRPNEAALGSRCGSAVKWRKMRK